MSLISKYLKMMTTDLLSLEINVHLMETPTQTHDVRRTNDNHRTKEQDDDMRDGNSFGALR
jgi:hypothetical protein